MQARARRPQIRDATLDDDTRRPLVVRPLVQTDRVHNADDIEVDVAAIEHGMEHGAVESRAARLQVRGSGGRKRSSTRAPQRRLKRGVAKKTTR